MNQTQSIIVYRTPLEQQMWEALMNGQLFPIIVGTIVFFIVFLIANGVMNKFIHGAWRKAWVSYVALGIGTFSGFFVAYTLIL